MTYTTSLMGAFICAGTNRDDVFNDVVENVERDFKDSDDLEYDF
jgi:hypothetical protein